MNTIKYIALVLLISNIYTIDDPFVYDTCSGEVFTYKEEGSTVEEKGIRFFEAKSANDCKNRPIREYTSDSYDHLTGKLLSKGTTKTFYTHCCYVTFDRIKDYELGLNEKNEDKSIEGICQGLSDYQYDHIKDFIHYMSFSSSDIFKTNDGWVIENIKVDCISNYVKFSLLSLLLLIFF